MRKSKDTLKNFVLERRKKVAKASMMDVLTFQFLLNREKTFLKGLQKQVTNLIMKSDQQVGCR